MPRTAECTNLSTVPICLRSVTVTSDFICDFGKLPFPEHLGKYFIKIGKISDKIHEIGKIKAIFGLGMTPIYGGKNGQINTGHSTSIAACLPASLPTLSI